MINWDSFLGCKDSLPYETQPTLHITFKKRKNLIIFSMDIFDKI